MVVVMVVVGEGLRRAEDVTSISASPMSIDATFAFRNSQLQEYFTQNRVLTLGFPPIEPQTMNA